MKKTNQLPESRYCSKSCSDTTLTRLKLTAWSNEDDDLTRLQDEIILVHVILRDIDFKHD